MKNFKSDFSINEIGKFRFYSGILVGIGFSLILNKFFRLTLKLCDIGIYINDLSWSNIYDYELTNYYLILIGFSSLGFAFCFTTYLWMSKPRATIKRKTIKLRFAQVNSIWIFAGIMLFLTRMYWLLAGVDLTIEKDFKYLGLMFPIFIFFYCWNLIANIYKSIKSFLISCIIYIISGFLLSVI